MRIQYEAVCVSDACSVSLWRVDAPLDRAAAARWDLRVASFASGRARRRRSGLERGAGCTVY